VVAGDTFSMFKDTPQARKLMQYLTTAQAQSIWVKKGGKIAVNKQVPVSDYPDPLAQEEATLVANTAIAKYDATDQMPAAMKNAAWADLVKFIQNQGQLNTLLTQLDAVQATAYKTS
jgi:alpha-glucoside transport system substrate-binding protein